MITRILGLVYVYVLTRVFSEDLTRLGRKARLWGKKRVERESSILGDANDSSILAGDFTIPHENTYATPPPSVLIELKSFQLLRSVDSVHPSPLSELVGTPHTESAKAPDLPSQPAKLVFQVNIERERTEEISFTLDYDISFVTAHPCAPSKRVTFLKSPESPTIRQIDVSGANAFGKTSRSAYRAGKFLFIGSYYS